MFVCLCKAVTDRDIARAMGDGARTVEDIGRCTGAGTNCGTCREAIGCALAKGCGVARSESIIALRTLAAIVTG